MEHIRNTLWPEDDDSVDDMCGGDPVILAIHFWAMTSFHSLFLSHVSLSVWYSVSPIQIDTAAITVQYAVEIWEGKRPYVREGLLE